MVAHEPLGPGGELLPPGGGVDREVVDQSGDEGLQLARRGELGLEVLGVGVALGDRPLRRQLVLLDAGVPLEPLVPLIGAAHDLGGRG